MWQIIISVLMVLIAVIAVYMTFFVRRILSFFMSKRLPRILLSAAVVICGIVGGYILFGNSSVIALLHLFFISLLCQLVFFILKKTVHSDSFQNKREFIYKTGIIPILLTVAVIAYGYVNMVTVVRQDYKIDTDKLSDGQKLRIAMISDLHMGTTMDIDDLQRHADKINAENPNVFVLVGDIVDESTTKAQMEKTFEILSKVKARDGVYYVYGNHDRATYSSSPNFAPYELAAAIENSGIKILQDETAELEGYVLVGREDNSMGFDSRKTMSELIKNIDTDKYIVNLDHQPLDLEENAKLGIDLQLSGHTHGGQVFPAGEIAELTGIFELTYGERIIDTFHAVTSSGIASWGYPIRTETHSEYVIVEIS